MPSQTDSTTTPAIRGRIMRFDARREVAIYVRDGVTWVAEFIDGHSELVDPATWFRCNAAILGMSHAQRRRVVEVERPVSANTADVLEALHRSRAADGNQNHALWGANSRLGPPLHRLRTSIGSLLGRHPRRYVSPSA